MYKKNNKCTESFEYKGG